MMMTPEQLEGLRFALEATVHAPGLSVEAAHDLFNHIDALQARIAELEEELSQTKDECRAALRNFVDMGNQRDRLLDNKYHELPNMRKKFEEWWLSGGYGTRPTDRFEDKGVSDDDVFEVWKIAIDAAMQK